MTKAGHGFTVELERLHAAANRFDMAAIILGDIDRRRISHAQSMMDECTAGHGDAIFDKVGSAFAEVTDKLAGEIRKMASVTEQLGTALHEIADRYAKQDGRS